MALSVDDRAAVATALRDHLRVFLSARFEPLQSKVTVVVHLTVAIGVGSVFDLALRLRRRGDAPTDWTKPDR